VTYLLDTDHITILQRETGPAYATLRARLAQVRGQLNAERLTGARPGPGLQIELRGSRTLEDAIRRAGRRIALAFAGGAALLAAVLAAAASSIDLWVPVTLGVAAGIAGLALVLDLRRSR